MEESEGCGGGSGLYRRVRVVEKRVGCGGKSGYMVEERVGWRSETSVHVSSTTDNKK